jgi:hypothetical protein
MPFNGVAEPEKLQILTSVLDAICLNAGIGLHSPERDSAAALVMRLYWNGCRTADEFRAAVDNAMQEKRFG